MATLLNQICPAQLLGLALLALLTSTCSAASIAKPSYCRPDLPGCCPKEIKHVVLLHIEKTGGTSLRQFLQGTLRKYFSGRSGSVICNYLRRMPYQCEASSEAGGNATCNARNFDYYDSYIASGRHFGKSCKLTSSHHDHRIIDAIPQELLQHTMLVTNFREPASRLVSHYHMLRRHENAKAMSMSVEDYFMRDPDGVALARNRMTRVLAGEFCCKDGQATEYASQKVYERALANLGNFCVVGLTSNVQDTFMYIEHVLGMRSGTPPKNIHYHNNSKKYGPVPPDTLTALQQYNQHDTDLFAAAKRRFEEQMAVLNSTAAAARRTL